MRNYQSKTVDEYIANAPEKSQPKLRELRAVIKNAAPESTEGISWGIPFYKYHGMLAGFSVFTNHISFGLTDAFSDDFRKVLEQKGYKTGKKIVQIGFEQSIPIMEITRLLQEKAEANEVKHFAKIRGEK